MRPTQRARTSRICLSQTRCADVTVPASTLGGSVTVVPQSGDLPRTRHGPGNENEAPLGASQLSSQIVRSGRYWTRTNDPCRVKADQGCPWMFTVVRLCPLSCCFVMTRDGQCRLVLHGPRT